MPGTRNKLTDLNDHLFAQVERLGSEDLKGEDLEREILRTRALCDVSGRLLEAGRLGLDVWRLARESGMQPRTMPLLGEMVPAARPAGPARG